jgi:hypothetical protein
MRFRELRRVLQHIVIAGLPATAACSLDSIPLVGGCTEHVDRTFELSAIAAKPPVKLRIESCRVDVDACRALCDKAMLDAGIGPVGGTCAVTFEDTTVNVHVGYDVATNNPNCPVEGRRPAGLHDPRQLGTPGPAGAWLAHAAWLEGASIYAFVQLAHELGLHGAPRALIDGSLAAARDEVRHTTLMTRLAARYGARPPVVDVAPPEPRGLEALAIENATEGCVRETWGAVLALWQAHTARDAEARATFAMIARDEARHAALAWAIDRWTRTRVDADARVRVALARDAAARELVEAPDAIAIAAIGVPHQLDARGLLARAHQTLWIGGVS